MLSLTQRGPLGAVALGVSISFDELAIGFSAGLLRLPILAMVIAIAAHAFIVRRSGSASAAASVRACARPLRSSLG